MARSYTEIVQSTTGGVIAVSTLAAAISTLTGELTNILHELGAPAAGDWLIWIILVSLLLLAVSLMRRGLSRKSRLLRPESLLINPDNHEHLCGRDDEINQLCNAVVQHPLVFLEGESGSGKSALVRSGLIPALPTHASNILPIYISAYSSDWDSGLVANLTSATWLKLSEDLRKRFGINTQLDLRHCLFTANEQGENVDYRTKHSIFYRIRNELGLIPLLIFDQFDDYLVAHRIRLLRGGCWITPDVLTAENTMWRLLCDEINQKALHCLFVTRREMFGSLEAVRFEQPEIFYLDRVAQTYIISLLEKMVAPIDGATVISNPNEGWEALKERLVRDLSGQGRILPIQARVAFRGLIQLPYLSIAAYTRKGGLHGLEAGTIEQSSIAAAHVAEIPSHRILDALMLMVDKTNPEIPKTCKADISVLSDALQTDPTHVKRALDTLLQHGVIRRQINDQDITKNSRVSELNETGELWSLYHDYLASPVLTARNRANHYQHFLEEKFQTFESAANLRSRWSALLSLWEQILLIWPSVTGMVTWTGYRRYALLSGTRLLPLLVALLGSGLILNWYLDEVAFMQADGILSAVRAGLDNEIPKREEYRQLWKLAAGSRRLKRAFLKRALEQVKADSRTAQVLSVHQKRIGAALFGLDPNYKRRSWVLLQLLSIESTETTTEVLNFKARFCALLFASSPTQFADRASEIADLIISAMALSTDPVQLRYLSESMGMLDTYLPPAKSEAGAKLLITAMAETTDLNQLYQLSNVLGEYYTQLSPMLVEAAANVLVTAMAGTADPYQLSLLANALSGLNVHLPSAQVEAGAKILVEAMATTTELDKLTYISEAIDRFGTHLTSAQAEDGFNILVSVMAGTTNLYELDFFRKLLGRLSTHLPSTRTEAVARSLVATMVETTDMRNLLALGIALDVIDENLTSAQAKAVAETLAAAMVEATDQWLINHLGKALSKLGEHLSPTQAEAVAKTLVPVMTGTSDPDRLFSFGNVLIKLGAYTSPALRMATTQTLVNVMTVTSDPDQLYRLGGVLSRIGAHVPLVQAEAGAKELLKAMAVTNDPHVISRLSTALSGFCEHIAPEQIDAGIKILLSTMVRTTDSDQMTKLSGALRDFGAYLTHAQAETVAKTLLAAMARTTHPTQLSLYVDALLGLSVQLPPSQAESGALLLVAAMRKATPRTQGSLIVYMARLVEFLSPAQVEVVVESLVAAIVETSHSFRLNILVESLGRVVEHLPPSPRVKTVTNILVTAMAGTTDPNHLYHLGYALSEFGAYLSPEKAEAGAKTLVTAMVRSTDPHDLYFLGKALRKFATYLSPEKAEASANTLVAAMAGTADPELLNLFCDAIVGLSVHVSSSAQVETSAKILVKAMGRTTDQNLLDQIRNTLSELGSHLPPTHTEAIAMALVGAMIGNTDQVQLLYLSKVLSKLSTQLPPVEAENVCSHILEAIATSGEAISVIYLIPLLSDLEISASTDAIETAPELLQTPIAYGETLKHLLRYYNRRSGQPVNRGFRISDDFVIWAKKHNADLDIDRIPLMPKALRD